MDKNTDIGYICRLIEKFYQGATTPAEEGILEEYFNSEDIPEELAKDAVVFRSLNSLLPNDDEIKLPEDLESQLTEITSVMPENKERRKSPIMPFVLKAASIAAAACLIWGLLTFIPRWAGFQPANQNELTAEAPIDNAGKMPDHHDSNTNDKTAEIEEVTPIIKQPAPRRIARRTSKPATVPDVSPSGEEDDNFIEITDPEEARQIMESIGNLLASNFSESDKAINTVNTSIESYKEITKTILQ